MKSISYKKINPGVIYGVLSGAVFSVYALTNRHVFMSYEVDAFYYVVTFSIVNGLCGLVATVLRSDTSTFKDPDFKKVLGVALLGISALSTFVFAQSRTTATNAAVLSSTIILSTALWSIPVLKEKPTNQAYGWMAVVIASVYSAIAGFNVISLNSGDLLVLLAVFLFGANNAYSKKLIPKFGSKFIIDFRMVLGGMLLVLYALLTTQSFSFVVTNAGLWPVAAGIASYINISLTFKAMQYISATNALVLNILHIVTTILGAAIFLDESITILKILGSVAIIYAIYRLVNTPVKSTEQPPKAMRKA